MSYNLRHPLRGHSQRMYSQMMDFQTPLSTLSGLVKPPSPCTSAMSRKNSCNLVYVKVFSFSTFFITINVNSKRVINAESYHFTTWLNSSNFTMGRWVQNRGEKKCVFAFFLKIRISRLIEKTLPILYVRVCPDFPTPLPPSTSTSFVHGP